jgi:Protein of unknown function (DUF1501)
MNFTRRSLLLGGLGLTQAALLSKFGHRIAYAGGGPKPTKFITIYVPGGWMPSMLFPPFSNAAINTHVKRLTPKDSVLHEFYDSSAVLTPATGAMGNDPGPNVEKQALRIPRLWNPASPFSGAGGFNQNGYAWVDQKLHEKTCIIHGIEQGTAAHESGIISSICGAAGSQFRAPAAGAVIANALWSKYKDARPLPSVTLSTAFFSPNNFDLPGSSSPVLLGTSAKSIEESVSDRNDAAWKDLRDRKIQTLEAFDPKTGKAEDVATTAIDQYVLAQTLAQRGLSSTGTDAFYSGIYDGLKSTSKLLAQDVITKIQSQPAIKADFNVSVGVASEGGMGQWGPTFDMALRLIRSDLVTSISFDVRGVGGFYFDTHGFDFDEHMLRLRQVQEVLGRFLGEMNTIKSSSGTGSLLDETLVFICSEFSRTFTNNGHWPTTSAILVGGGINGNLMVGNYDLEGKPAPYDPIGIPIPIVDDKGAAAKAIPKSADVCATLYAAFGISDFFIPGGYGEILGVRST